MMPRILINRNDGLVAAENSEPGGEILLGAQFSVSRRAFLRPVRLNTYRNEIKSFSFEKVITLGYKIYVGLKFQFVSFTSDSVWAQSSFRTFGFGFGLNLFEK